jgi:hypothetical protein
MRYMTHGPPNFLIWETWVRNLDLEGKIIPRWVTKAICHSNISLKTLFIDLFF